MYNFDWFVDQNYGNLYFRICALRIVFKLSSMIGHSKQINSLKWNLPKKILFWVSLSISGKELWPLLNLSIISPSLVFIYFCCFENCVLNKDKSAIPYLLNSAGTHASYLLILRTLTLMMIQLGVYLLSLDYIPLVVLKNSKCKLSFMLVHLSVHVGRNPALQIFRSSRLWFVCMKIPGRGLCLKAFVL